MTVKTIASIDIETAGLSEKATVLTVGAVIFVVEDNPQEMCSLHLNFNTYEQRFALLREWDEQVLEWWETQPEALRNSVFRSTDLPVAQSLGLLTTMIEDADEYWANSPNFDLDILNNLYADCKMKSPLAYKKHRDYRTLMSLYEKLKGRPWQRSREGNAHDALWDARNQGLDIINSISDLKGETS